MNKLSVVLALASVFLVSRSPAISLDDIPLWTGSGTNRAAVVIEWNSPEIFNDTSVSAPIANKTMVWGYRFNGTATGTEMLNAVLAADPKLYVVENNTFGTFVEAIGYNLNGQGIAGVSDGSITDTPSAFVNGAVNDPDLNGDAAYSLNNGDLFWSGYFGPNWQVWTEENDEGGFENSPNRGSSPYWNPNTYVQGQWAYANYGLDDLFLTNGSWIGFSIAPDGFPENTNDPSYATDLFISNNDVQAPPSPDGTYTAYVCNTNDFAVQIVNSTNLTSASPYNDPAAVLGRPTLQFVDLVGDVTDRVSIIDDPYNVAPGGGNVIAQINKGGEITVNMGHKVYDDPNNPYGIDLIVYGNSFFWDLTGGTTSDDTDLNATLFFGNACYGHTTIVSVSQDGTNWFTYNSTPELFPDNAYRWDDTNDSWTDEELNPAKPLNPFVYTNNFTGQPVAGALDQFTGAAGGTGYALRASGFPWIQYVRVQAGTNDHTVIDAIAAVDPVVVGDALAIAPDNLAGGISNLDFQNPANPCQNLIALDFDSISDLARVSTVALNDFSSFAPVTGQISSAYKIAVKPVSGGGPLTYLAEVGLRAGAGYTGGGGDLRVYEWNCTNWISRPFTFNPTNDEAIVAGITNFSAYVVSRIIPPQLSIQPVGHGFAFQFTPVANCAHILERSTDLADWTPILTNTPASTQPLTLQDTNAPSGNAYYRLVLNP